MSKSLCSGDGHVSTYFWPCSASLAILKIYVQVLRLSNVLHCAVFLNNKSVVKKQKVQYSIRETGLFISPLKINTEKEGSVATI